MSKFKFTKFFDVILLIFTVIFCQIGNILLSVSILFFRELEDISSYVFGRKKNVAANMKFSLTKRVFWDTNILVIL